MNELYDIIILGGGPAGLTAGIYALRARMNVLLIEKGLCGGQMLIADSIENFPGFPEYVKGMDLAEKMTAQAQRLGLLIQTSEVNGVSSDRKNNCFVVSTTRGEQFKTISLIVATGAHWNTLGVPGESELVGKGVSYCATCDGPLFREKEVVVVGGGDTALVDTLFLSKFAKKITLVHRRDRLRATKILQERAFADKKITFCWNSVVTKVLGKERVEAVSVQNVDSGKEAIIKADGIFVFVGITPNSGFLKGLIKQDEKGYIITDREMKTSAEGVFACGDVRQKRLRQISSAVGEAASAAFNAQHYVERAKGVEYK